MEQNKLVVKIACIDGGELQAEKVYKLTWPDNWYPPFENFVDDFKCWLASDKDCVIDQVRSITQQKKAPRYIKRKATPQKVA